jgi:predicted GNAT family N-acyltransferase
MSGPPDDVTAAWARQLYVLYVYAADHGTGAGQALLEAVINPAESVALWVADPNPRAQAFYRKHGFVPDGTAQVDDGVREIRMIRDVQHSGTGHAVDVQQEV